MQVRPQTSRAQVKSVVALALTFTAGIVDIVGYLAIYHLFVAHMTGTTVHMGNKLVTASWRDAIISATILLSFVLGSIAGRTTIEVGSRTHRRSIASLTLSAEALFVLSVVWLERLWPSGHGQVRSLWTPCIPLALLAAGMGVQTATLTRIGPPTIHTTFVTGMLNKLAQSVSEWLFWAHDRWRHGMRFAEIFRGSKQHERLRNALFMSGIWFSYMIGSVAGTWMNLRFSIDTLYLPVVILAIAAVIDQFSPLSIEEEKEQA